MKDFSKKRFLIGFSPLEVRLVYTFFLIFMLFGFLTIAGYEFSRIGVTPNEVAAHYVGSQDESSLKFEKGFNEILETAHFHAFIMGIIYLTLAHLFVATTLSRATRITIVVLAFVFTLLDLVLPAAIRFLNPGLSKLLIVAWIGEWVTYMFLILTPLFDMWIRCPAMRKAEERNAQQVD